MKNIFEFTNEKNGYSDILIRLRDLCNSFNGNLASNDGAQYQDPVSGDVYTVIQQFFQECEAFKSPILYIWGQERQEFFKNGNEYSQQFIAEVNKIVSEGNLNCLMNIAAEEHTIKIGQYPEWLTIELKQTEAGIRQSILLGHFDGLESSLYNNIISDFEKNGDISIDETKNTYQKNVANIRNYILDFDRSELTHDGKQLFESLIVNLSESRTPFLDLKAFKTNAQKVAPNDTKLVEIFNFVKKEIGNNPSLNVLLNIAKEEHYQNTNRVSSKQTEDDVIKSLGDIWTAGDSEIEQGFKAGIFKDLKSNLAMQLTLDIEDNLKQTNNPVVEIKDIDQKQKFVETLFETVKDLSISNPIGIIFESANLDKKYIYTSGKVLQILNENDNISYQGVNEQVEVPQSHSKLINALDSLIVDEENLTVKPKLNWGFNILINEDGKIILFDTVNNEDIEVEMNKEDLLDFFNESIQLFEGSMSEQEINNYQLDADNFILVALNFDNLSLMDDLIKIQSLNENTFVIVPENNVIDSNISETKKLQIITSSSDNNSVEFPTYTELINNINKRVGINTETSVNQLFESQISFEQNKFFDKNIKIQELKESQKNLNFEIVKNRKLIQIAEENSPAFHKLNEEYAKLDQQLNENINDLSKLV